eukprot:12785574-Alexandrium_andersonii.AAC.1
MSASLVGSEMCIRDSIRHGRGKRALENFLGRAAPGQRGLDAGMRGTIVLGADAVHLANATAGRARPLW